MPARRLLHAAVLALANLAGLWLGFVIFARSAETHQLAVQLPVAVTVSVAGFVGWVAAVRVRGPRWLRLQGRRDGAWIYGLALAWSAAIFVPLHLVLTGYLTAASNVIALWIFQVVVNVVAVWLAVAIRPPAPSTGGPS